MIVRIAQFSGGGGSWGAAKRVVAQHGTAGVLLLFADTLIEDQDCYRFLLEGAANVFGVAPPRDLMQRALALPEPHEDMARRRQELAAIRAETNARYPFFRWLAEGRTPHETFRDERMLGNSRFDPCSKLLKRQLIDAWKQAHCAPADTICYVGIDWSEKHRYDALAAHRAASGGWRYEAPLCAPPWLTPQDVRDWMRRESVDPPRLYALGFHHNNCGGGCIKAGQGHWAHLLRVLPERYAWWEAHEQEMRDYLGKDVSMLTDRRGDGKKKPLTLTVLRERVQGGGQADLFDIGGCGCALEVPDDGGGQEADADGDSGWGAGRARRKGETMNVEQALLRRCERERDEAKHCARTAEARARQLGEALAFAASVIKSGETWTPTCEAVIGGALRGDGGKG